MKIKTKQILQAILGVSGYLFLFSIFKILALRWDRVEGQFLYLLSLIPEDGIVLDIGANIGIMTVHLARTAYKGTVHAFEPMPINFKTLQRIVTFFQLKNVMLHPVALGNETRDIEMVMPVQGKVWLQGLSHVVIDGTDELGDRAIVPCQRLDDMSEFFTPTCQISAIKIDVENFEYFVFDGARNLLKVHRPIVYCELATATNRKHVFDLFNELGYITKVLVDNQLQTFNDKTHSEYSNFFLLPH